MAPAAPSVTVAPAMPAATSISPVPVVVSVTPPLADRLPVTCSVWLSVKARSPAVTAKAPRLPTKLAPMSEVLPLDVPVRLVAVMMPVFWVIVPPGALSASVVTVTLPFRPMSWPDRRARLLKPR